MNLLEDLLGIYENPEKPLRPLNPSIRHELFVAALHDEVLNAWKKFDGYVGFDVKIQALKDVEKTLLAEIESMQEEQRAPSMAQETGPKKG